MSIMATSTGEMNMKADWDDFYHPLGPEK